MTWRDEREQVREKYAPYAALETPDQILRICNQNEKMERLLLRIKNILEGGDVPEKSISKRFTEFQAVRTPSEGAGHEF